MRRTWQVTTGVVTLLLIGGRGLAVQAVVADTVTTAVAQALAEEGLIGVSWSLVTPSQVVLGAAGVRDLRTGVPFSPDDRVQVGSVAKTLLATGVLVLVTEGRINLDAPVTTYLPDIRLDNPWAAESPVLVRHLLDHTSGLGDARLWQVFTLRGNPDAPLRDGLGAAPLPVGSRPGRRFSYSNVGYLVLGMVIEAVTGERYEGWLDDHLLAPLGMTRSTAGFVTQGGARGDATLAMGHFENGEHAPSFAWPVRPAAQFTTTPADMATLARFLMSDGVVDGRQLVATELLHAMARPTTTEAVRAGLNTGYAMGLLTRERWGITGRCHLGNSGTFRGILCLYPEQQRAFFAAFNSDPETANFDRVDSLLGAALEISPTPAVPVVTPGIAPEEWAGWYVIRPTRFRQFAYLDAVGGITRVAWDGTQLSLRPVQGTERHLAPVGGALFRLEGRRAPTHVLLRTPSDVPVISDGLRTLERVEPWRVILLWASAAVGIVALLGLFVVGLWRTALAWRQGRLRDQPLRWIAAALLLLCASPLLYLGESFLAIGDPTPANLAVAVTTGLLPLAVVASTIGRVRAGLGGRAAQLEVVALVAALQWCLVLAAWGLLPLMLWW
jgi:CubicO group peptidase (beta-lactamase class C family)